MLKTIDVILIFMRLKSVEILGIFQGEVSAEKHL